VVALNGNRQHGQARIGQAAVRPFRRGMIGLGFAALVLALASALAADVQDPSAGVPIYSVHPIGWVRKSEGRTTIVIDERYQLALLGIEALDAVWVLYWLDRNNNPAARSVLQVHPQDNPANPLRGVFATRSPFRPNLIALSRVKILAVRDNVIEIDSIDALPDTPVLDLKP
jgi:tRNA-Thr(GGU) m(6)t(6)A37 methyltransferase TsaA